MKAEIQPLFTSALFRLYDFKCREEKGTHSGPEWSDDYSISFTRQGNFGYQVGGQHHDIHSGVILLQNAGAEYRVSHHHHVKDACTSLCAPKSLLSEIALHWRYPRHAGQVDLEEFSFPGHVVASMPALDYLHALMYGMATGALPGQPLRLEVLAVSLLQRLFAQCYDSVNAGFVAPLDNKTKARYLEIVDRGKNYILNNFQVEIDLQEIARHAYASPFHFTRVFKHITSHTPYQYLLQVRLNHAELLLQNTDLSVTEICYEAGFNSLEQFISTFTQRHGWSPLRYRQHKNLC